eukprot:sb/3472625/
MKKRRTDRTNQNLLFRARDWLSANQGPAFPDSVGSLLDCLDHRRVIRDTLGHHIGRVTDIDGHGVELEKSHEIMLALGVETWFRAVLGRPMYDKLITRSCKQSRPDRNWNYHLHNHYALHRGGLLSLSLTLSHSLTLTHSLSLTLSLSPSITLYTTCPQTKTG